MGQTSYNINQATAYAGMKSDAQVDFVESKQAENAIKFGIGVVAGTIPETQVKVPASSGDLFRGIALHIHKEPVAGVSRYEVSEMVSVLRKGRAWVECATGSAIALSTSPRVIVTGADAGKFTGATTGSMAVSGVAFASIYATAGSSALVEVDVNLP